MQSLWRRLGRRSLVASRQPARTALFLEALEPRLVPSLTPSLLTDINQAPVSSIPLPSGFSANKELIDVNGTLFFTPLDGVHGRELWRSNGTAAGTVLVKDINPGMNGSTQSIDPQQWFTNVNGTLFFAANDGVHGTELWKSNGTTAGTVMVKDIDRGPAMRTRPR